MTVNVAKEVAALRGLGVPELRRRYAEVFGESTRAGHKAWLIKRIVWRLQALAEGDLSERARRRAEELANDADLRLNPPRSMPVLPAPAERTATASLPRKPDERLPVPGTVLTRRYKGRLLEVRVLEQGFEFDGQVYPSLTATAKAATGQPHINGFLYFGLTGRGGKP